MRDGPGRKGVGETSRCVDHILLWCFMIPRGASFDTQ